MKRLTIIAVVLLLLLITLLSLWCSTGFDGLLGVSPSQAIAHFQKQERNIFDAADYFVNLLPDHRSVYVEFKPSGTIDFWVHEVDSTGSYQKIVEDWDVAYSDSVVAVGLGNLGWTIETLEELKQNLRTAGAISAHNRRDYIEIGYKRSGFGKYSFAIFEKAVTDSSRYDNGCRYLIIHERVVLEYGGGAFGNQCMP